MIQAEASRAYPALEEVPEEKWLTIEEAAAYLNVSRAGIYRFCDSGELRYYELRGRGHRGRRFRRRDLDGLLILVKPKRPGR